MHRHGGGRNSTMKKALAIVLAVGMVFSNSILAGETLVRDSIKSEGFVTGVNGWSINRDGTAEFSDLISRGSLIAGPNPGTHIEINGDDFPGQIALYSGNANESRPGIIKPVLGGANYGATVIQSPTTDGTLTSFAFLDLEGFEDGHTSADLEADNIQITAGDFVQLLSNTIKLGDSTAGGDLLVANHPVDAKAQITNEDEVWKGTAVTALAGTWVDTAGSRFGYYKEATGRVQVRGKVSGGGAGATIVTLPAGYRPTSNLEFTMRAAVGVIASVSVSTAGVLTVTTNLASASANGIFLDVISFPTF
jgi:hypothetical protein